MKGLQVLGLIFCLSVFASAQNAILSGTVYDQQGSVIPNASVKLKNRKGKEYQTQSDENGFYQAELVKGFYSIEIKSNNFKTFRTKKYFVSPSYKGKMFFDVALEVTGEVSDKNGFF